MPYNQHINKKMISIEELRKNNIFDWCDIAINYEKPNLLLGNGFSLQFSDKFSYISLFNKFIENCDPVHQTLFRQFETENFEQILCYLTYAKKVHKILKLPTELIDSALDKLKHGLISTIQSIHPRSSDIDFDILKNVALQLKGFGDIFTTNYDLYLYHIIMLSKDISSVDKDYIAYQDYFWGSHCPSGYKQFVSEQSYEFKHLYYLHGSLCFFKNNLDNLKLIKQYKDTELIDLLSSEIENNNFPIFITEGSGLEKQVSISENIYLSFCLNKLKQNNKPILIFGNRLGEFDGHILEAIKAISKDIIYCIYIGDQTIEDVNSEKYNFLSKFNNYNGSIKFVDSSTVFKL